MRVDCILVVALMVLVDSIVCIHLNRERARERVYRFRVYGSEDIWYKDYHDSQRGHPYTLRRLVGTYNFLERDGLIIGFGEDYGIVHAMCDNHGRSFVLSEDGYRLFPLDYELAIRGVGGRMPPFVNNEL